MPRALESALEDRLEAADEEFRELRGHVRSASMVLLVLAVLYAAFGLVAWFAGLAIDLVPSSSTEREEAWISLAANLAMGGGLFGCFLWARRSPLPAIGAAAVLWLAAQVGVVVASGQPLFYWLLSGLGWYGVMKLVTLLLLARGLLSGWRAARMRERLSHREVAKRAGVYR